MRESKSARFCRLAEARVNKIIKMIRLLGNCSGKAVYQYDSEQVEEIFAAIQFELDAARHAGDSIQKNAGFRYRRPAICIRIYWPIPIFL